MLLKEFVNKIRVAGDLKITEVNFVEKYIRIENKYKHNIPFSLNDIHGFTMDILFDIARGIKSPNPLYHLSRVVGYYSRIENWNESKLAERKARRAGNYSVSETAEPIKVECTDNVCKVAV